MYSLSRINRGMQRREYGWALVCWCQMRCAHNKEGREGKGREGEISTQRRSRQAVELGIHDEAKGGCSELRSPNT